jgi:4,5-dihydroxyphthalate decarboxylase
MSDLKLKLACNDYDRCRALLDGTVKPQGIALDITRLKPRELFPRMLDHQEFDVAELSLSSYATLTARDKSPFVAIPVMLSKLFRHSCIYVRKGAGIERPEDLKGKRVGTTQFGATAIVYIKGMLQDEYGIKPEDLHWFIGGLSTPTEPPLVPLDLPGKIALEFLPRGQTLEAMFADNKLDALFAILLPRMFLEQSQRTNSILPSPPEGEGAHSAAQQRVRGRKGGTASASAENAGASQIARLFPNYREVEEDYYRRTRILPIMHTVVIRKDVYNAHPFVAQSLYRAFCESRDRALEPLYDTDALMVSLPFLIDHIEHSRRVFGADFWAYGLEPNRPSLDALCRYVHEQGLAPRRITPDELFVPVA